MAKRIICPNLNCNYQGEPKRVPRGNALTGLILLLLGFWPGVLYFGFKSGYRTLCPNCGLQLASDW